MGCYGSAERLVGSPLALKDAEVSGEAGLSRKAARALLAICSDV